MASSSKWENGAPHVALFPAAGMGHLLPFLRLAAMLDVRGCAVTLIAVNPTVSDAESHHLSTFFAIYPQIKRLQFHLLPYNTSGLANDDPFFIHMETIANSINLLRPFLSSSSPPLSAVFADFAVTSGVTRLASDLSIPVYTVVTTSATFFSFMTHLPHLPHKTLSDIDIQIPALCHIPLSSIPLKLLNPNHYFRANIILNASSLSNSTGVVINTFTSLEPDAIQALRRNGVEHILPIGPLESLDSGKVQKVPWLDEQAPESVLFISFGSRTALSKPQTRAVAAALEKMECKFLWVLKGGKVDKEDKEGIEEMVGASFVERTKRKGVVIKEWVEQEQILAHPAIGGFFSHCGWNSVIEAAKLGVPVLGWPQHGDQSVNAEVVEKAGLGVWAREWGWGETRFVGESEIAAKLAELMGDDKLRSRAKEVKERGREAREIDGSSESLLRGLIHSFKTN